MADCRAGVERDEPARLVIRDLCIGPTAPAGARPLVQHVSFDLAAGRVLWMIGGSGSGKTLTARAILNILPVGLLVRSGQIRIEHGAGSGLAKVTDATTMIWQDPEGALCPVISIGRQMLDTARSVNPAAPLEAHRQAIGDLLSTVGIPARSLLSLMPHQISGGMKQRICIAMALLTRPQFLLADEATSNLDLISQFGVMRALYQVQRAGVGILMITHNLNLVRGMPGYVLVMHQGTVVDRGEWVDVCRSSNEYTAALLRASKYEMANDGYLA